MHKRTSVLILLLVMSNVVTLCYIAYKFHRAEPTGTELDLGPQNEVPTEHPGDQANRQVVSTSDVDEFVESFDSGTLSDWQVMRYPGKWTIGNEQGNRLLAIDSQQYSEGILQNHTWGHVEITVRIQPVTAGVQGLVFGYQGLGDYWRIVWEDSLAHIRGRVNDRWVDAQGLRTSLSFTPELNVWHVLKLNVGNGSILAKWWPEGEPEPNQWQLTAYDNRLPSGSVGVIAQGQVLYDDLRVRTISESASASPVATVGADDRSVVADVTGSDYEGVDPAAFSIRVIDRRLKTPTRMKFSPDATLLFVAELQGRVQIYERTDGLWTKQGQPFFDLGNLNVSGERGLTGLFLGADFSQSATESAKRDVFLCYQLFEAGKFRNRITRVTVSEVSGAYVGTEPVMIYEGPEPPSSAHQIHDGIGFVYEGQPHLLVSVGDGFIQRDALDVNKEGHGKLLLMQRDGTDPLGKRPWPEHPKVAAIGIRNTYGMIMAPERFDPNRRLLGAENGNVVDRIWFLEVVDFGHESDERVSLGWNARGDNYYRGTYPFCFPSVQDLNRPGPMDPEAVLAVLGDLPSPNCLAWHPGKGIIPGPNSTQLVFVMSVYGRTSSTDNRPGKCIVMGTIANLQGAQPGLTLTPIIRRKPAAIGKYGNPVALDVDPATGDIYFADIITGELSQATPIEADTDFDKDE